VARLCEESALCLAGELSAPRAIVLRATASPR
jgi:hypothetical protein